MFQTLLSEKNSADAALSGWQKMLSKAVHPKTGEVATSSVEERLRSFDAAWRRYDDCHYKLMSVRVGPDTLDSDKEEEQVKWDKRLEDYCEAREEAIETLKSSGVDLKAFEKLTIDIDCEKLKADGKDKKEFHQKEDVKSRMRCETTQQHPSQETHSRKKDDERAHRQHHSHNTKKEAHAEKRSTSPTRVGCFQRPNLPDEIKAQSAVRDDLVISGHRDFNSLYASNDTVQQSFTVNILGAPNDSTTTCGCDNIYCPFCNLVKNIANRDPSL